MAMSTTLKDYLTQQGVDYEVQAHPRTLDSSHTAQATHVPGDHLAKAVMVEGDQGYLMVVIPSTHKLSLKDLHYQLQRRLVLATERELQELFPDCELGAIPPLGQAFGLDTVVDEALLRQPEIWFEAGDHEEVVHISGVQFKALMAGATAGQFSHHR